MFIEHAQSEPVDRRPAAGLRFRRTTSSLQPPASSLPPRGISLLEVLIAMFVMLFGLMGVAAIFPVGNHYAGKSDQYDRGAALANSAFAELKARGMLRPESWVYSNGAYNINQTGTNVGQFALNPDPGHAFVIDPIGAAQSPDAKYFPYDANFAQTNANPWLSGATPTPPLSGATWPIRRQTFAAPDPANPGSVIPMGRDLAGSLFRLRDDLSVELPTENDHPGILRWAVNDNNDKDPTNDVPLARAYVGGYSWLATVVPTNFVARDGMQPIHPQYGSFMYEVAVAVFYKRDLPPSRVTEPMLSAELGPGGDLVIYSNTGNDADDVAAVDGATEDIRPGRWIALAGVHPDSGKFLLRWYRLLSLDDETADRSGYNPVYLLSTPSTTVTGRHAMLEGPDWPMRINTSSGAPIPATNLRAILLPGVIGVTTQTVKLNVD